MKKTVYLVLLLILHITVISCKKENDFHEVKYVVEFLEVPSYGYSNQMSLIVKPVYDEDYNRPAISYRIASTLKKWEYQYLELKTGDKIDFGFNYLAINYYYKLSIYIDGSLVSHKEIFVEETSSAPRHKIINEYGIDNDLTDQYITFTY